ncbi:Dephospho-CoA kinase [Dillenia turbinata]|uniref:Dephospho-CoA kinase n=1 Tax=Dillenia turbinata TaxID=194707 RepID=A0AAN8W019_9MAGN
MDKWTRPIIVVWVDPETQLQLLMARDKTSEEDARNRIKSRMHLDLESDKADRIIENTRSIEDLNECFEKEFSQNIMGDCEVDPETQLQLLMARDKTSEEDARNKIKSQMHLDLRRDKADRIIENTSSMEDLNKRFEKEFS